MAQQKIKHWVTGQDGLDRLRMEETECPSPGQDEVLVEVHSVSLNYRDTEVCMGLHNHHKTVSQPPAMPPTIHTWDPYKNPAFRLKEGDRVISTLFAPTHISGQIEAKDVGNGLGGPAPGVLVQYRVFPTFGVIVGQGGNDSLPGNISAVQIACAAGAHVLVTLVVGREAPARATELGRKDDCELPTAAIRTGTLLPSLTRLVQTAQTFVLELGGAQTLCKSFACVRFGGVIACIGYLAGKQDVEGDREHTNVLCL
ncbi:hypothetical protein BDU57DRAFT_591072 [Ampelomyces quisqualis]|uniref:Chaperonin 10-like protein n=1 Tax=Ampelomyces quisqualis TaxID=50730 RepID=A0A6A5Q9P7_AMPQU|nr:hypothetical protein BDU57DRAFT_591072 [Ampelomyces quisqualis]